MGIANLLVSSFTVLISLINGQAILGMRGGSSSQIAAVEDESGNAQQSSGGGSNDSGAQESSCNKNGGFRA